MTLATHKPTQADAVALAALPLNLFVAELLTLANDQSRSQAARHEAVALCSRIVADGPAQSPTWA